MVTNNGSNRGWALVAFGIALVAAGYAPAEDPKEKERDARAKAAIAMTAPGVRLKTALAPAPRAKEEKALCTDASCACAPGTKGAASDQIGKALAQQRVVVVFYGGVPARCCGGVLVGVDADVPPGVSDKLPIVVYAPSGPGSITPIASLPRLATNDEISAAIRKAQAGTR